MVPARQEALIKRALIFALSCLMTAAVSLCQSDAPQEVPKPSVKGKVVDIKSGQPIRKVNIEVMGGAGETFERRSATTSADGAFSIDDLKPGRYTVTFERSGFVQTAASRRANTFTLQPGQSLSGLLFKLQAAGVISGRIVDADGDPMGQVGVSAMMTGRAPGMGRNASSAGATNDLGEYRIANLSPGKYWILAAPSQGVAVVPNGEKGKTKEHLTYAVTYFPGSLDKSRAVSVEVHSGEEATANFAVGITHAYRVSGVVSGVPTGGMTQFILASKNGDVDMDRPVPLMEGNRFVYENVLPGTYMGTLFVVKGMFGEGQRQPEIQMLRLTPPIEVEKSDVEGVQLQPEAAGLIHGRFRMDTGEKFDWSQLILNLLPIGETEGSPGSPWMAVAFSQSAANLPVNSDGTFEMKDVPGGTYQLIIGAGSDRLRDYYTKAVTSGGKDVADTGFIVNGEINLEVLVSAKGATIDGQVVDGKGQPVPYGVVVVVPDREQRARPDSYQQEATDERGHFMARGLNPGNYVVLAFEELEEDTRQPEFLKTYGGKGEKVDLAEGARKSVTVRMIAAEPDGQ